MALFDFLKGKKKPARRTGVRTGASNERLPTQPTQQMNLPPPPPGGEAPFRTPPAPPAPDNRTMVRPVADAGPSSTPPPPVAPVVSAQPQPPAPPAYPPPQHADSGQTQYITVNSPAGGEIVGVLVAIDGELTGQLFRIVDGKNRMGRGTDCEIELNSQKISRAHAEVIHQSGTFAIMPLSDMNPTFVNDQETSGDELRDGDTIRLGLTTLKFRTI